MSTYYFMLCDDCKERCHAVSRITCGWEPYIDSDKTLQPFMIWHAEKDHKIRIVSEYHDDAYSDEYTDWTEENYLAMYERIEENPL